jgi:hypothetical protein
MRIAFKAASTARTFQSTTSRSEAQAALPALVDYFAILAQGAPVQFDIGEVARTELDWWQARREDSPPERYGLTIAQVSSLLYGVDNADLRQAGVLRAQAMAYRDRHATAMTQRDWDSIGNDLDAAYGLLKRAIALPAPR